MHQSGLIIYALKRADWFKRNPCIISRGNQAPSQATAAVKINFEDLSGAFVVLALGVGLAATSFLAELIAGGSCSRNKGIKSQHETLETENIAL